MVTLMPLTLEQAQSLVDRIEDTTRREVDRLHHQVAADFEEVYKRIDELKDRLDRQNGKIDRHETVIGDLRGEVRVLGVHTSAGTDSPYLTKRDLWLAVRVLGALFAVLQALVFLAPYASRLLKP